MNKRIGRIVGFLFILATFSGIMSAVFAAKFLGEDMLNQIYIDQLGLVYEVIFILIMAISVILIPIVLFPIAKKVNLTMAIGYIVFRLCEGLLFIGMAVSNLTLLSLSKVFMNASVDEVASIQLMSGLISDGILKINIVSGIVFAISAIFFYYMLYQSKLLPRVISIWGLIGAILYLANSIFGLFGMPYANEMIEAILLMPLGLNEMVMAVYLLIKGFSQKRLEVLND